jgi:hypothetical protein
MQMWLSQRSPETALEDVAAPAATLKLYLRCKDYSTMAGGWLPIAEARQFRAAGSHQLSLIQELNGMPFHFRNLSIFMPNEVG